MSSKRQSSYTSAAATTGHNEDLMTQISVCLPVKSILSFRSVSKKWYSLLTHPQFIKRYFSNKRRYSMLLFQRSLEFRVLEALNLNGNDRNLYIADFGYLRNPSDHGNLRLAQSCYGLLLFESHDLEGQVLLRRVNRFYVSNPFTKKSCELEVPDYLTYAQGLFSSHLYFDPCTSPYYKVIFFWNDEVFSREYHISIFSSETKTCKNFEYTLDDHDPLGSDSAVYNGAIFWSGFLIKTSTYFDINEESIKNVPLNPPYSGPDKDLKYFGGYGGHLHLIMGNETDHVLDVYELKEDYLSWVAKYKVDIESIAVDFPEIIISREDSGLVVPLFELVTSWYNLVCEVSIGSGGKRYKYYLLSVLETEEEPTIILYAGNKLLAYNFIDKTTKKLYDAPSLGNIRHPFFWRNTVHCIESLWDV